eukprot:EG_transcript_1186
MTPHTRSRSARPEPPHVVLGRCQARGAVLHTLGELGCTVLTSSCPETVHVAGLQPEERVAAMAQLRAQTVLNNLRSRGAPTLPQSEKTPLYVLAVEHVLILDARLESDIAADAELTREGEQRPPSDVDGAPGAGDTPRSDSLDDFVICESFGSAQSPQVSFSSPETSPQKGFDPARSVRKSRGTRRASHRIKPADREGGDGWVVLHRQQSHVTCGERAAVLCCAVALDPVTDTAVKTTRLGWLPAGAAIAEETLHQLQRQCRVLKSATLREDEAEATVTRCVVPDIDSLIKSAVVEVVSLALASFTGQRGRQFSLPWTAAPDAGANWAQGSCGRCSQAFGGEAESGGGDRGGGGGLRRIFCFVCRRTVCSPCCSSPVAALDRTRPRGVCRSCAVMQCRRGLDLAGPATGYFSMCSGSSMILETCPQDLSGEEDSCNACGQQFSLFRRPTTCAGCFHRTCARCLMPPLAGDGRRQCIQCQYQRRLWRGVDNNVPACLLCHQRFSLLRARRCCRRCGKTICNSCSATKVHFMSPRPLSFICKQCFVPKIFRLSYDVAHYFMEWLDEPSRISVFYVSKRFRKLTVLSLPCIDQLPHYYRLDSTPQLLGTGGFGAVYRAVCRRTGEPCAVKVISKDKLKSYRQVRSLEREVAIHSGLRHPGTVEFREALQTTTEVFLVMGIAGDCDLVDHIIQNGRLPEEQAMRIIGQLLRFLVYLHGEKYTVHRDLKPDNVMLTRSADGTILSAKVVDFGLSKALGPPAPYVPDDSPQLFPARGICSEPPYPLGPSLAPSVGSSVGSDNDSFSSQGPSGSGGDSGSLTPNRILFTPCGTLRFCAPEVLIPGGYKTRVSYSAAFKRDIFSLGVVAYTMLCGRLPYRSEVVPDLQVEMTRPLSFHGSCWEGVSEEACNFVRLLCSYNAQYRPTAEDALRHPWLRPRKALPPPLLLAPRTPRTSRDSLAGPAHRVTHAGPRFITMRVDRDREGNVYASAVASSPLRFSENGPRFRTRSVCTDSGGPKRSASAPGPSIPLSRDLKSELWAANSFYV